MGPRLFELIRTDPDLAATPVAVSSGIPGTSCFTVQEQSGTVFACVGTVQRYVFLYAVEVPLASHPNVQTNMRGPLALQAARLPKAP